MDNLQVVIKMPIVRKPTVEVESKISIKRIHVEVIPKLRILVRGENKTFSFMMEGTETVSNLKAMILNNGSVSAKYISIWFNDEELDDTKLLSDCSIYEDSILNFRTAMKIYMKLLTGQTKPLWVDSSQSIHKIKLKVEKMQGILCKHQTLVFNGKQLEQGRTLADYNVQEEDTLHVYLRLYGS